MSGTKATIGVALTTTNSTATMPAGTKFTSTVDGVSYQFVTITSRSLQVLVIQLTLTTQRFTKELM